MAIETRTQDFQTAAAALLDRFERLWESRESELIREIVAADAVSHWSGLGAVAGHEYPERWRALVQLADDLQFQITGHAAQEPFLFISWHVRATVNGRGAEYDGVDRFRLRGEQADEVYVVFDPGPMRELLKRAQTAPPASPVG
jgi:hypothetical protein